MPEPVDLPPLPVRVSELWEVLFDLGERVRVPWTIVGGQMVLLHAIEHGTVPVQVSQDADLLVDLRTAPSGLRTIVTAVEAFGFELEGIATGGVGHRYQRPRQDGLPLVIDLLAPDHLGERADLTTSPPGRTIEVPGGRQALARTEIIEVRHRDRRGRIPRPSLAGAIIGKARACPLSGDTSRHERDLALLLSLVPDPFSLREQLNNAEIGYLHSVAILGDPDAEAWRLQPVDRRGLGIDALAILLGS